MMPETICDGGIVTKISELERQYVCEFNLILGRKQKTTMELEVELLKLMLPPLRRLTPNQAKQTKAKRNILPPLKRFTTLTLSLKLTSLVTEKHPYITTLDVEGIQ
ncbi:hypothetical protein R6Q59_027523 [Mikania micrantha]